MTGSAAPTPSGDLVAAVLNVVRGQIPNPEVGAALEAETSLADLGLDSLRTVALLVALEKEFALEFPPPLITAETFRCARTIAAALRLSASHDRSPDA
ncbi:phosphopantetheine-binding protein [Nonomuraea sp. NPDC050786]|uniref:phosphopantetheine-binding protein n=1 Tax=Nonomuraea sp. NPDC050786 TaxID=3154840 RepID=UPI0033D5E85B